jgi:hypothetical protein
MSLENCPPDFYLNCKNYIYKCTLCSAGNGKDTLYYKPKQNIGTHPAKVIKTKPVINKLKSKQIKSGYLKEKQLVNQIAKQTIKSGSVFHDGDILIADSLKLDSKLRHKLSSFSVSRSEYEKGISQNLDGWIITNKEGSTEQTVVVLTFESFNKLISLLTS